MLAALLLCCATTLGGLAQADAGSVHAAAEPRHAPLAPSGSETQRLAAGTLVEVEMVDGLSSSTAHIGDKFSIRLSEPIARDGVALVLAGAAGQGEVIDAARAGMGGKQGKLIISARSLELNGRRVRVRGMTLMVAGKSRGALATGVLLVLPYGYPAGMLIRGGEIEIPAGARATVRLTEDVDLPLTLSVN